jgi:hypothetical protein
MIRLPLLAALLLLAIAGPATKASRPGMLALQRFWSRGA